LKQALAGFRLRFYTGSKYVERLQKRYGGFPVEEYTDVLELEHGYYYMERWMRTKAYAFFIKDAIVIPECNNPEKLIEEYRLRMAFIFVAYQSHNHLTGFNNNRNDVFILDNRVWEPYKPNIIPKVVLSNSLEDRKIFEEFWSRKRLWEQKPIKSW
jgi:hypothetical protein